MSGLTKNAGFLYPFFTKEFNFAILPYFATSYPEKQTLRLPNVHTKVIGVRETRIRRTVDICIVTRKTRKYTFDTPVSRLQAVTSTVTPGHMRPPTLTELAADGEFPSSITVPGRDAGVTVTVTVTVIIVPVTAWTGPTAADSDGHRHRDSGRCTVGVIR